MRNGSLFPGSNISADHPGVVGIPCEEVGTSIFGLDQGDYLEAMCGTVEKCSYMKDLD
jgi:hypothetical protein